MILHVCGLVLIALTGALTADSEVADSDAVNGGMPEPRFGLGAVLANPVNNPLGFPFNNGAVSGSIGSTCASNGTCASSNGYCKNGSCACLPNFITDPVTKNCRIAPGYNEPCAEGSLCRESFVCNSSNLCGCPTGYIEEYLQCVRDCSAQEVPINGSCYAVQEVGQPCQLSEQCIQAFAECANGKCQCIPGTQTQGQICTVSHQCPIGEPVRIEGQLVRCTANTGGCDGDSYCMFAELTDQDGYCCPKVEMACPVGQPLPNHNCTNCPWETHHCFSYVIGSYTESMCCPNACPSSQPIQKDGKCYPRSAFGGRCTVDEQCYSVVGASCRANTEGDPRCQCPEGPYFSEFGQCLRRSFLNETCRFVRECHGNTQCVDEYCQCLAGWLPAPDGKTCLPKPTCPVPVPAEKSPTRQDEIKYCEAEEELSKCGAEEFCHKWWTSTAASRPDSEEHAYALCCPKPKPEDFNILCQPYNLRLMFDAAGEPRRCDLKNFQQPQPFEGVQHDAPVNNITTTDSPTADEDSCPTGAACLFDPYTVTKGVCCEPEVIDVEEGEEGEIIVGENVASVVEKIESGVESVGSPLVEEEEEIVE